MTLDIFGYMLGKKKQYSQTIRYIETLKSYKVYWASRDRVQVSRVSPSFFIRAPEKEELIGCGWDSRKIKGNAIRKMEPTRGRWQKGSREKGVQTKAEENGRYRRALMEEGHKWKSIETEHIRKYIYIYIKLMGSMNSILLSIENSCEGYPPFQIYLFWI